MSKSILLADDSVTIRKVVELTFMDEDYELESVGSGEEALVRLEEADPDLVIADVHMSGVSGYEVCRRVKQERPGTPVLLLVGTFEPFDPADVETAGGDRFLKKPFDSQELLRTVRELLVKGSESDAAAADDPREEGAGEPAGDEPQPAVSDGGEASAGDEPGPPTPSEPPVASTPVIAAGPPASVPVAPPSEPQDGAAPAAGEPGTVELSEASVDRIARRVAQLLSDGPLREVAWEVVPDLAEVVIKERLRELESQVE